MLAVVGAHGRNGFADLLPIRADVLHRRSAYQARNSAQTLDACQIVLDAEANELVPVFPGASGDENHLSVLPHRDSPAGDVQNQSVEAFVRHHQITPATENENGQTLPLREAQRLHDSVFGRRFRQIPGGSPDAQRGVGGERHVFFEDETVGHGCGLYQNQRPQGDSCGLAKTGSP